MTCRAGADHVPRWGSV